MLNNQQNMPTHVAIIMDGNGRWAQNKGQYRAQGHESGVISVRKIVEACVQLGIKYLTLYTFSIENWNRPADEVGALMQLFVATINGEKETLMKNNVRLNAIGDIASLPVQCQADLAEVMNATSGNKACTLTLALSYGARWEIAKAAALLAEKARTGEISPADITPETFSQYLTTPGIPDPELLIRTGGEIRVSNFLLWQIAYTELYFTDVLWPDFRKEHLVQALNEYQNRERRFGKTSAQVQ